MARGKGTSGRSGDPSDMPPARDKNVERAIKHADREIEAAITRGELSDINIAADAALRAFQLRLLAAMGEKGWSQSDLARACGFGRSNISSALRERNPVTPRPTTVATIARALGVDKEMLFPTRQRILTGTDRRTSTIEVKRRPDGHAHLHVDQVVTWDTALKVMELLKGQDEAQLLKHRPSE